MEQGLAASIAQQAPQQGGGQLPSVDEVIQLLMEGVPPEKLEAQGIPPELIMQAIQIIEQQMAQQGGGQPQQAPAPQPQLGGGLAQQAVGG